MTPDARMARMPVEIICSALNAATFLPAFLRSVQAQSHQSWRLWIRDDGSTDETVSVIEEFSRADDRITLLHIGGPKLGVAGGFGWVLERVPADAAYVMVGDADDVWLPDKVERELAAMVAAERESPGAVLVHSDLVVVDEKLAVIHPSFWTYSRLEPEPVSLRRLVIGNVATAPTVMLNRELCALIGRTPSDVRYQDWWYALIAVTFGRIVALREATVLYRQHSHNVVGARRRDGFGIAAAPREIIKALSRTSRLRADLAYSCLQAAAFLSRYRAVLGDDDRLFLEAYSLIPTRRVVRRKIDLLRLGLLRQHGLLRNLGMLLRG